MSPRKGGRKVYDALGYRMPDGNRDFGCIVTLDDGSVHHRPGFVLEALRDICETEADPRGAKVVTISTPATVLRDLKGDRTRRLPGSVEGGVSFVEPPELDYLGRIHRLDLLANPPTSGPEIHRSRRTAYRRRRHR